MQNQQTNQNPQQLNQNLQQSQLNAPQTPQKINPEILTLCTKHNKEFKFLCTQEKKLFCEECRTLRKQGEPELFDLERCKPLFKKDLEARKLALTTKKNEVNSIQLPSFSTQHHYEAMNKCKELILQAVEQYMSHTIGNYQHIIQSIPTQEQKVKIVEKIEENIKESDKVLEKINKNTINLGDIFSFHDKKQQSMDFDISLVDKFLKDSHLISSQQSPNVQIPPTFPYLKVNEPILEEIYIHLFQFMITSLQSSPKIPQQPNFPENQKVDVLDVPPIQMPNYFAQDAPFKGVPVYKKIFNFRTIWHSK